MSKSFVILAKTEYYSSGQSWHRPASGLACISDDGKQVLWNGASYTLVSEDVGLEGSCVALMVKSGSIELKLYTSTPTEGSTIEEINESLRRKFRR